MCTVKQSDELDPERMHLATPEMSDKHNVVRCRILASVKGIPNNSVRHFLDIRLTDFNKLVDTDTFKKFIDGAKLALDSGVKDLEPL
jgi:hypothetical protein